jgi:ATP-dependent DNA helicase RecG
VKIVELLKEDKYITNQELADTLGLSTKGIEWQMKKLKESGVIQRVGSAKGGYWEVLDD